MTVAAALAFAAVLQLGTIDWAALPALPYRAPPVVTQPMTAFVAREATQRNCPMPAVENGVQTLRVEIAVLVDGRSRVRTVVPRAINCATVEQYAAGLVQAFARANLLPRGGASEQWYKTSLTFTWKP